VHQVNIHVDNLGVVNQGTVGNIANNPHKHQEPRRSASATTQATDGGDSDLAEFGRPSRKPEVADLLCEVAEDAAKPPQQRRCRTVMRTVVTGLGQALSHAADLRTRWTAAITPHLQLESAAELVAIKPVRYRRLEMRPLRRTRVLVIEDDGPLRELYRQELVNSGYLVTAVADGLDALKRIDDGLLPEVVVLDLVLPRLNGLDFHRELKAHANTRNVPIIVVTGTDTRELNPTDFAFVFRKPITGAALVRAIDAAVPH